MKSVSKSSERIRALVSVGLFSAIAYVCCVVFHFKLSFLSFDLKDSVMAIGAMFFGPVYGITMAVIVALIEALTISSTGVYGFIMNVISSATYVGIASFVYKRKRTLTGAVVGLVTSSAVTVGVMLLFNVLVTPFYMNVSREAVFSMLLPLLLPFNITKTVFNSSIVFLLYKPVTTALRNAGMLPKSEFQKNASSKKSRYSTVFTLICFLIATLTLVYFFFGLNGSFSF